MIIDKINFRGVMELINKELVIGLCSFIEFRTSEEEVFVS